jgi:hypothetical protein
MFEDVDRSKMIRTLRLIHQNMSKTNTPFKGTGVRKEDNQGQSRSV